MHKYKINFRKNIYYVKIRKNSKKKGEFFMQQTLNSRRSFIAAAGLFFATTALKAAPKDFSGSNVRYGMAIDLTRCVGCQ